MLKFWLILALSALFAPSAFPQQAPLACDQLWNEASVRENSVSSNPKHGPFAIGLLVRKSDGSTVLGLAPYLAGLHKEIWKKINAQFGEVAEILWGGEVVLAAPLSSQGTPTILALNQTSSFVFKVSIGKIVDVPINLHSLEEIRDLMSSFTGLIGENLRLETYDETQPHFFSPMNRFRSEFILSSANGAEDTIRHRINNSVQGLISGLLLFNNVNSRRGPFTNDDFRRMVDSNLTSQSIEILGLLYEAEGFDSSGLAVVIDLLKQMQNRVLSNEEINTIAFVWSKFWQEQRLNSLANEDFGLNNIRVIEIPQLNQP